MRFTSVAVMAGSALAHGVSTDYATQMVTITACPDSVPDCPARSMTTSVITSGLPVSTSTIYSTKVRTITSCGPEVADCPAHSTVVSTEMVPVTTAVVPGGPAYPGMPGSQVPGKPAYPQPSPEAGMPSEDGSVPVAPGTTAVISAPTASSVCPISSVMAMTKTYTTVLTSVEYSTIQTDIPCAAATQIPQGPAGEGKIPKMPEGPQGEYPPGAEGQGKIPKMPEDQDEYSPGHEEQGKIPKSPEGPQGQYPPGPEGQGKIPKMPKSPEGPQGQYPPGPVGTGVVPTPPAATPPTGYGPQGNSTEPGGPPTVTAGAASKAGSVFLAVAAGVVALAFA